jgi:YhcG PDDEXK nuclease domain
VSGCNPLTQSFNIHRNPICHSSTLLEKLRDFLVELSNGFAFMGSEYPLQVSDQDFYLDLLFYHYRLRCLVAIDLKIGEFKPEDSGKINFYLSVLDAQVKHPNDRPSVGIILCKLKDRLIADYALANLNREIGLVPIKLESYRQRSKQSYRR